MSFFSGFTGYSLTMSGKKLNYTPPGVGEGLGTFTNIITSILSIFSLVNEYDSYYKLDKKKEYNIDKILIGFIILAILLITLYYIIRESIIDKTKENSDITINIVYFSLSMLLLFVYLVYVFVIKK